MTMTALDRVRRADDTRPVRASTRGAGYRALQLALNHRKPFVTSGALKATVPTSGGQFSGTGELRGPDLDTFRADRGTITYIVWSYATPIWWARADGTFHRVAQRFSMTTSHHQGKLWAAEQPTGYFDAF